LTLGALATFHFWPGLVEIAIRAGLDYLILDLEHLTHDQERMADACAIGRLLDFPVLIRPPAAELTAMRLALDLGPCGMLVPYVEDVATMDVIRDAVYLKPRGKRRPGGLGNRWVADYNYATWKAEVEDDLIILPQIESQKGLANVEAIARHPLTTAMAVGPYDLSADLGICWQPDSPLLPESVDKIRQAARAAGKNMWNIGDPTILLSRGYTFLCIAEPIMLLENTLKTVAGAARSQAAPAAGDSQKTPLP
jgi:2-keto-3-deoxy-L-rhamnonate aldolase RhmA